MSSALDRELNEAIVNADISNSYEEFLAIFGRYYPENVEVASDTTPASLTGKAHVLPILIDFLMPLHVMAEIGGVGHSSVLSYPRGPARGAIHRVVPRSGGRPWKVGALVLSPA